jgi:hypothetical protein
MRPQRRNGALEQLEVFNSNSEPADSYFLCSYVAENKPISDSAPSQPPDKWKSLLPQSKSH